MAAQRPSRALLYLTVLAAPAALGLETVLRKLLFPPEFEEFRAFLRPLLTPVGWLVAAVAVAASVAGLAVQRRMAQKRIARLERADFDARYREVLAIFLISTAVPQVPAIISTLTFMFGASFWPVAVGVGFASVGVVLQAWRIPELADELG
jgi:predicted membrane channel-forming protein YqfA (hemolysin III family)